MERNALSRRFTAASLLRFSAANVVMMIFLSLYTIVDGMFISRLVGTLALSAVNMSYPLNSLELALGIMLGTGASAVIAREMGAGEAELARRDFSCVVAVAAAAGGVFALAGNALLEPILEALGTSALQLPYAETYTRILLWFAPALFLQTVFQVLFVTAGKPGLGLGTTVLGGVSNMVLDYWFMGPLEMGVAGAAVATGVGYCIPAAAGLYYFLRPRDSALWFVSFRPRWAMLLHTCGNGSSEMVSNIANALTTFLFNIIFLRFWGEDGVASITIAMYFQFVFTAVFFGFSMGAAPVISYKYGAEDTGQLRRIVRICLCVILACSLGAYLLARLLIGPSLILFTDPGTPVYEITMEGFPLYAASFLVMGVSIFASSLFTAFSNGLVSAVISFARTFVFLVGMLLIMPQLLGRTGIWLAVPAAEVLGLLVSAVFLLWGRKKYQYA